MIYDHFEIDCDDREYTVWLDDYDKNYKGKYKLNGTMAYGMCLRFAEWLRDNTCYIDEDGFDVLNNTSGLIDGNRLDIHENYILSDNGYEIGYLWAMKNGNVYAEVYDRETDEWIGSIEVCC